MCDDCDRYRDALEYYADKSRWTDIKSDNSVWFDCGARARLALRIGVWAPKVKEVPPDQ